MSSKSRFSAREINKFTERGRPVFFHQNTGCLAATGEALPSCIRIKKMRMNSIQQARSHGM